MQQWQNDFVDLLRDHYQGQRERNSRYSIRAFARQIEVPHGPLSAILKGSQKWNFSTGWAQSILNKMKIKNEQRNRMFVKMGLSPKIHTKIMSAPEGLWISHWAYWPTLAFFELPEVPDVSVMSAKLGLPKNDVKAIIKDLIYRRFLVKDSTGRLILPAENLVSQDDIPIEAFRDAHKAHLKVAEWALKDLTLDQREFQTVTMAGSMSALPEVKAEIRAFTEKLVHLLNKENANDEVFRFSIQLFPFLEKANPNE